jgi:3-deoxy-D-manno-octulosonic-acid transferase
MFALYTILYAVALLFIAPFEYFRRPSGLRKSWFRERLGLYPSGPLVAGRDRRVVWVHAVSVGEAAAAVSFVKRLYALDSQPEIVISTVTDTGRKVAVERMGDIAKVVYVPFDLPFCVSGAASHIRPDLFIIMETEIWPNIIRLLERRGVPVILMNGRISRKSFRGYLRVRGFISRVLTGMDGLYMQEEQYAERIRLLGAPADRVTVTGNFKFDMQPPLAAPEWTGALSGAVIIAGSTHRGEEDLVLDAYAGLLADMPGLNLILAPRHPERFAEAEELVMKRGLSYVKRSSVINGKAAITGRVVILDVIGELASVYAAADIAVMGGSFIPHGGQNPLEPAYWGKAVICGPHMENFPFIDEFYEAGAALRTEPAGLATELRRLLSDPGAAASMGGRARVLYDKNTGAVGRAVRAVVKYLPYTAAGGTEIAS